jgi:Replication-relaxation
MVRQPETRQSPIQGHTSVGKTNKTTITPRSTGRRSPSLLDASKRLQPRDYLLARLLDEHTTLTTTQIASLLFTSVVTCQHRLQALRRLGFVDRFVRNRPGAPGPMCWVPGLLSARYVALERGDRPPTARIVGERQDRTVSSPTLRHLLGVNEFFVRLLVHARYDEHVRLARWWSERRAVAAFGKKLSPDGLGVWVEGRTMTGFFLEYDMGTEPLRKLAAKPRAYRLMRDQGGPPYVVLFVLPSRAREQNLHRRLAEGLDPGVAVATTSPESGIDPAGPVWRLFGNGRGRYRLGALPGPLGDPGPYNPGLPEPADDPLWLPAGMS